MNENKTLQILPRTKPHKLNVLPKAKKSTVKPQKSHQPHRQARGQVARGTKPVATDPPTTLELSLLQKRLNNRHNNARSQSPQREQSQTSLRIFQPSTLLLPMQYPQREPKLPEILRTILSRAARVRRWLYRGFALIVTRLKDPKKKGKTSATIVNAKSDLAILALACGTFGFYRDHVSQSVLAYLAGFFATFYLINKIKRH